MATQELKIVSRTLLSRTFAPSEPVSASTDLCAARDAQGRMLVVSVGKEDNNRKAYLLRQVPGETTGWKQYDLTPGLPAGVFVRHLALAEVAPGKHLLTLAVRLPGTGGDGVFLLDDLRPPAKAGTPWPWRSGGTAPKGERIAKIAAGVIDDGRVEVAVSTEQHRLYHLGGAAAGPPVWDDLNSAVDLASVTDFDIGQYLPNLGGVYLTFTDKLGKKAAQFIGFKGQLNLELDQAFPIPTKENPSHVSATCSSAWKGQSILYVAAQGGIFRLTPDQQSRTPDGGTLLTPKGHGPATALISRNTGDGGQRLWVVDEAGTLGFATVTPDNDTVELFPLRSDVAKIGVTTSAVDGHYELCAVDAQGQPWHVFQDAATSRWKSLPIHMHSTGQLVHSEALLTRVAVTDAAGNPRPGQQISITPTESLRLVVDGASHFAGPNLPLKLKTDGLGGVTLENPQHRLGSPSFRVTCAGVVPSRINPGGAVASALSALSTDQLRKAVDPNSGKPLLPAKFRSAGDLKQRFQAVRSFVSAASKLPAAGSAKRHPGPATPRTLIAFHTSGALLESPGPLKGLKHDLHKVGDWLERAEHDLVSEVKHRFREVEDGIEWVVDETRTVLLRYAEQAWSALGWLVRKTLGLAIDALVALLGQLFEWAHVKKTQKAIDNLRSQFGNFLVREASTLETLSARAFKTLRKHRSAPPQGDNPVVGRDLTQVNLSSLLEGAGTAADEVMAQSQELLHNPVTHWAMSLVRRSGVMEALGPFEKMSQILRRSSLIRDAKNTFGGDLGDGFEATFNTWNPLLRQQAQNAAQGISIADLLAGLDKAGDSAVDRLMTSVESLAALPFKGAKDLVKLSDELLDIKVDLPVLSLILAEVSKLAGGSLLNRGSSAKTSLGDALSLLMALPVSVASQSLGLRLLSGPGKAAVNGDWKELFGTVSQAVGADTAVPSPVPGPRTSLAADVTPTWYEVSADVDLFRGMVIWVIDAVDLVLNASTFGLDETNPFDVTQVTKVEAAVRLCYQAFKIAIVLPLPVDVLRKPSPLGWTAYACSLGSWTTMLVQWILDSIVLDMMLLATLAEVIEGMGGLSLPATVPTDMAASFVGAWLKTVAVLPKALFDLLVMGFSIADQPGALPMPILSVLQNESGNLANYVQPWSQWFPPAMWAAPALKVSAWAFLHISLILIIVEKLKGKTMDFEYV